MIMNNLDKIKEMLFIIGLSLLVLCTFMMTIFVIIFICISL